MAPAKGLSPRLRSGQALRLRSGQAGQAVREQSKELSGIPLAFVTILLIPRLHSGQACRRLLRDIMDRERIGCG